MSEIVVSPANLVNERAVDPRLKDLRNGNITVTKNTAPRLRW